MYVLVMILIVSHNPMKQEEIVDSLELCMEMGQNWVTMMTDVKDSGTPENRLVAYADYVCYEKEVIK